MAAVISEPRKIKSVTVSPSICHEVMAPDAMILVFWMLSFKPTFSLSSFTFSKNSPKRRTCSSASFENPSSINSETCVSFPGSLLLMRFLVVQMVKNQWQGPCLKLSKDVHLVEYYQQTPKSLCCFSTLCYTMGRNMWSVWKHITEGWNSVGDNKTRGKVFLRRGYLGLTREQKW